MRLLAAVLVGAAAVLVMPDGRRRAGRVLPAPAHRGRPARPSSPAGPCLALLAGAAVALLLGGAAGLVIGASVATVAWWLVHAAPCRTQAAADAALLRAVPLGCDLLAACVAAGASPQASVRAVAAAVPGPLGAVLCSVARSVALGAPVVDAWSPYADGPAPLRTLAAVLSRSSASGASPAALLDALAVDQRERQRLAGEAAARRAGVATVAPLGLCFLPAFVLLGVVPLVAGLLGGGVDLLAG